MKLSILIKTFNEERNIERCLDAVFAAKQGIAGGVEVIVADSLSTDATVALARKYPLKIVQLQAAADRGCGTGVQLGFQHAAGEFVYLLDGDMELQGDFLAQALALIEREPTLAGVSGALQDRQINNRFDHHRVKNKPSARAGEVEWLAGGGLYRRAAVADAGGYAGNRNLKAYEEAELGLRLRSRGWRMLRLAQIAVLHTGHADSTFGLIARQWRSGRLDASGVLLKSAIGQPWLRRVVRLCMHPLGVIGYWSLLLVAMLGGLQAWAAAMAGAGVLACLALVLKKRSLADAGFSLLLWHVAAAGLLRGLLAGELKPPQAEIASTVLSDSPAPASASTTSQGQAV